MNDNDLKKGARVRLNWHHWLRQGQTGVIVEHDPYRGTAQFLVQFDQKGAGIDGDKLWEEANQLTVIPANDEE